MPPEGLCGATAAYMLKMHQSYMIDGNTAVELFGQLDSRQREHNPDKPLLPLAEEAPVCPTSWPSR